MMSPFLIPKTRNNPLVFDTFPGLNGLFYLIGFVIMALIDCAETFFSKILSE